MSEEFIGAGWGFPIRTDATGGIALVTREREIEEAIRLILATAHGERPLRPEFGCAIHEFIFAPADSNTAGRIAHEVKSALHRWEPRVEVVDVICSVGGPPGDATGGQPGGFRGPSTLYIDVRYRILGTYNPRSLVFPFYTIPLHGESGPEGVEQ
ncbi:MAG: uncharacterized protein QOG82_103 [Actinomycetota bacterium]|jgi:phage baseplate assembly protein W|nr:uncharacterized protein [Actinomycetota bacterium]